MKQLQLDHRWMVLALMVVVVLPVPMARTVASVQKEQGFTMRSCAAHQPCFLTPTPFLHVREVISLSPNR